MTTAQVRLYLGRTMAELNRMAEDIPRINCAKLFIPTADQAFKKAQECQNNGDEEMAYVMYMRFFNIITAIKKTADFKRCQNRFDAVIGGDKCNEAIEQAEEIAKNLQKRYAELDAFEVRRELRAIRIMREQAQQPRPAARSASAKGHSSTSRDAKPAPLTRAKSQEPYNFLHPI